VLAVRKGSPKHRLPPAAPCTVSAVHQHKLIGGMTVLIAVDFRIDDNDLSHNAVAFIVWDAVVYGKRGHIKFKLFLLGSHKPYLLLHPVGKNLHSFQIVV
jgi:hypothetical protein